MSLTRVVKPLIDTNTISQITFARKPKMLISNVIYTTAEYANTANTFIDVSGGYIKVLGRSFEANANVFVGTEFVDEVPSYFVNFNEYRLEIPSKTEGDYDLFIYNPNGRHVGLFKVIKVGFLFTTSYGWFVAGSSSTGLNYNNTDRFYFATDTDNLSTRGELNESKRHLTSIGNSSYGWFGGGLVTDFTTLTSTIERLDFSNDLTNASTRTVLNQSKFGLSSLETSTYGYFAGGNTETNIVSVVERMTFSSDTDSLSTRGNLSQERKFLTSTQNENYGLLVGGSNFGIGNTVISLPDLYESTDIYSTVDRIDFSSDTSTASVRGPLENNFNGMAAVGTNQYAWFGGGQNGIDPNDLYHSSVYRINYTNDTGSHLTRGPLSLQRGFLTSVNSNLYGWFAGGTIKQLVNEEVEVPGEPPTFETIEVSLITAYSTIDRIDFSNDTINASVRSSLNNEKLGLTGTTQF